ncbi:MAG: CaiB/BaiF CoA transferase family protein [Salinirussus sp.]
MTDGPGVLDGHVVVEATQSVAGAMAGRLLAEFGADVVLLEIGNGHPIRHLEDGAAGDQYVEALLAAKRSLLVDDVDSEAVTDVLAGADVLITDDHHPLNADDNRLLTCHIIPFGTEMASAYGAADPLVMARTGITATSGFPDGAPAATAVPIASALGAIVACGSIVARLYDSGDGGEIEVSLRAAILPLLTTFVPAAMASGESAGRSGNRHPLSAPWNTYRANDGWVYLIAWTDEHWQRFLELADREDLEGDERFETNRDRRRHAETVDEVVEEWVADHTVGEVVELAEDHGLTATSIRDVAAAFTDENLHHRGMVVESNGHRIPGSPLALTETPGRVDSPAPAPGGDGA